MNSIVKTLQLATLNIIENLYDTTTNFSTINVQPTRKEFEGDYTLVVFPLLKISKKKPEATAEEIGNYLVKNTKLIAAFNCVKGFLNLSLNKAVFTSQLQHIASSATYGKFEKNGKVAALEYCGPNTNKALHFGHFRNMMVGFSTANILEAAGYQVHKVNILNDRGIQICKSMLAWQKYAEEATPESTGKKGDHFVADYYVKFQNEYKAQVEELIAKGTDKKIAETDAPLMQEARAMLLKWEAGDKATKKLWKMMNDWVYEGFEQTFNRLGVDFEKNYYESETYNLGKELVQEGLQKGVYFKKEDGSVWIDLTDEGLDEKLLLRADGTSVYLTQDLGTAQLRYEDFKMDKSIYVVGDEQNYHFKVLQLALKKLGKVYADGIYHLSYGMVDLPGGAKMKSREGTAVDTDDLMDEVVQKAAEASQELGKIADLSETEKATLFEQIGIGAMKYFILKVQPQKRMVFDPAQSIDLIGNTGPFIQYAYTRIQSILEIRLKFVRPVKPIKYSESFRRKVVIEYLLTGRPKAHIQQDYNIGSNNAIREWLKDFDFTNPYSLKKYHTDEESYSLQLTEKNIVKLLDDYPLKLQTAAKHYDPSEIANFAYDLAKAFNKFYAELPILKETDKTTKEFRFLLCLQVGRLLKKSFDLLGISLPKKM